jgi:hypothetical protein
VDLEAVRQVYALRPLSQELVSLLNPEVSLTDLARDISEVGYPQPDQESTWRQLAGSETRAGELP